MKVIKEIFMYVLVLFLIILIFGIIFYDKLPSNKIIPVKADYALPENLGKVLDEVLEEEEEKEVLVTYTVEETDLDRYKSNKQYDPGKIDPFKTYSDGNVNNGTSTGNGGSSNENQSSNKGNSNKDNKSSQTGRLTETKPGK